MNRPKRFSAQDYEHQRRDLARRFSPHTVAPCRFCGRATASYSFPKESLCDGCWEVSGRLGDFIRDGGDDAIEFVRAALEAVK